MGSIPFAISIHKFISSTGADAGFAAIVGLAILILLYFAQARETATLREQAAEAADRVGQLEQHIGELLRRAAQPAPAAPAAARAPAPAAMPAGVAVAQSPPRVHLGPPAGVAAPALAAATRLIPLPSDNGVGEAVEWPGEPIKVHRATEFPASPSTVAGGNGHGRVAPMPVPAAPRRRIDPAPGGAGARPGTRPRRPLLPPEPPPRRRSGVVKALIGLLGLLIVAAGVAALLIVTNKSSTGSTTAASRTTNAPGTRRHAAVFNPRTVTVAVLNGTGTTGLAHRTALRLTGAGYRQGTVATATDQTHTTTEVAYLSGDKSDAGRVAAALKLPTSAVTPIDPTTQAVACPPPAACTANVVVTVGSDLASVY